MRTSLNLLKKLIPWLITFVALYLAFRGVDWSFFWTHVRSANYFYLGLAVVLTCLSYLARSFRWQFFFDDVKIPFWKAAEVLILGFFMNNVLPARAGELVRAHMGAKIAHCKRTLVLASIASERLADGLTISLIFLIAVRIIPNFSPAMASNNNLSDGLYYVSYLFAAICFAVFATLILRRIIFKILDRILGYFNNRIFDFAFHRFKLFLNGLEPLFSPKRLPWIITLSLFVWIIELTVFHLIGKSFHQDLGLVNTIVFMVAVNFSSLIPAAPGGIGVIEAIASAVLVSLGYEQELALSLVLSQHVIQYLVVGVFGSLSMIHLRSHLKLIPSVSRHAA
jgi:glycosyltransferase 2 family protein